MKSTVIFLLWAFAILQVLDCISTYKGIKSGEGKENNPVVAAFIKGFGLVGGLLFVTGLALAFIFWYLNTQVAGSVVEVVAFGVLDLFYLRTVVGNFKIARG